VQAIRLTRGTLAGGNADSPEYSSDYYNVRSSLESLTLSNIESVDARRERLTAWSRTVLARADLQISVASADASFRRYFRGTDGRGSDGASSWIVVDAPPEKEDSRPYIKIAAMLVGSGVNAPRVLAENLDEGYLLLSDLGNRTYLAELADTSRADKLYTDALVALVQMQRGCASRVGELPPYDEALLRREMELFPEWFLGKHLGIQLEAHERAMFDAAFSYLSAAALTQPRVFVHRDYHSRNLMVTNGASEGPNPGVLDFQDAVFGPTTYDLVSLLRDCYIEWPLDRVHAWVREYRVNAVRAGLPVGGSETEFLRWFDLMGVQRHLKATGIFSRLAHRDGKFGYLNDIPRTLNYIRAVLPGFAELRDLAQFIESRIAHRVSP
jgi:N-acetylmuramate 1-kinase